MKGCENDMAYRKTADISAEKLIDSAYEMMETDRDTIRRVSYNIIKDIGANQANKGFDDVIETIVGCYADKAKQLTLSGPNSIYEYVARINNRESEKNVSRSIRHLIKDITEKGNEEVIDKIFGKKTYEKNCNKLYLLSNSTFIYGIVSYIYYELGMPAKKL